MRTLQRIQNRGRSVVLDLVDDRDGPLELARLSDLCVLLLAGFAVLVE